MKRPRIRGMRWLSNFTKKDLVELLPGIRSKYGRIRVFDTAYDCYGDPVEGLCAVYIPSAHGIGKLTLSSTICISLGLLIVTSVVALVLRPPIMEALIISPLLQVVLWLLYILYGERKNVLN